MKHFYETFNHAMNSFLDISNDDLPPLPEKQYSAAEMALIAEHYLEEVQKDADEAKDDPFQCGMLVFCQSSIGPYYGHIVKRLGWSSFWSQNKYDVMDVKGKEHVGVFQQDMERVKLTGSELMGALKAGVIKGGKQ